MFPLQRGDTDDDSDAEFTDDGAEETALESYQTPIDEDTCQVDEYVIFKHVLQCEFNHFLVLYKCH